LTIDEAIKRNIEIRGGLLLGGARDDALAVFLGIEALKRCKKFKERATKIGYEPLPGETKE